MISIALCTYNGERYIKEQINSIINQSLKPDELVVSDDNSSDNTIEIIEKLLQNTGINLRINVNNPGLGVFKNFEKAISLCQGDYIFCCDQDDIWKNNKIELHMKEFEKHPDAIMVFSNAAVVLNGPENYLNPLWDKISDKDNGTSSFKSIVFCGTSIAGCCMTFKRSLLEGIFPFPDNVYHDDWLATNAVIKGEIIGIDEELMYYRQHGNNVFGTPKRNGKLSYYKSIITNYKGYIKHLKYIYNRHLLVNTALINMKLVNDKLALELRDNIDFSKNRASIDGISFRSSIKNAISDRSKGYYKKYTIRKYEFLRDLYDICMINLFKGD